MVTGTGSTIDAFLDDLAAYQAERVFNPWTMNCEAVDVAGSFGVRRDNLHAVLSACANAEEVDVWIGRDLGWRGGRRTGVALVDETSLGDYAHSIGAMGLRKATTGPAMRERTATEIHIARARVPQKLFFWNVFPFHPHEDGKPQSNRMHTRQERDIGMAFLTRVLELLPVGSVVTIGNDATHAVQAADFTCCPVRHPSYGGQKEFHRQIDAHYGISSIGPSQTDLFS